MALASLVTGSLITGSLLSLLAIPKAPASSPCPSDMAHVAGDHVEDLQRVCTEKRFGNKCFAFAPGLLFGEGARTALDVCVDRFEWPNRAGALAEVMVSYLEAEAACASVDKRLCTEYEWELACEGAVPSPWPYGWSRERGACNNDKTFRAYDEQKLASPDAEVKTREVLRLMQAEPSGSFARCESAFGVKDQIGNVEEWVRTSRAAWPYRSSLKGGYWSKPWSGCRGTNESHSPGFRYYQTGFRCCRDADRT